jgi:UPF0755 protein
MRRLFLLLVALVIGAAAAAAVVYVRAHTPFRGYAGAEQFVEIPPGSGPASIGRRLVDAGVVSDRLTWRLAVFTSGAARDLQAGEYRFAGDVRPITFREGLTIREMARLFEERGFGTAASFEQAAKDTSLVKAWDAHARDLEGYLFPETYGLPRRTDATTLVRLMVNRFAQVFPESARQAAVASGRTVRQVVTLASIVEKETGRAEERPLVAAVYANRLKIGMGLQCDPTVIYALQKAGTYDGNLTRENMGIDSPYNTYRYAGLPPGPIAAPGRASLEAALQPADVDALYFVSRNDGSHVFSKTYEEHAHHVAEYQRGR